MKWTVWPLLALLISSHVEARILRGFSSSSLEKSNLSIEERSWLNPWGPLSRTKGVLSAYGPLGRLGPFGDDFWNATFAFRLMGNWQDLAEALTQLEGPLSAAGPLFLTGTLAQSMASFMLPPGALTMLSPGGSLHVLGNGGALGPLGIAGALGPNGAHGFERNERGDYLNKNNRVVKTLSVKLADGARRFDLFELYRADAVRSTEVLDTSFALRGTLASRGERKQLAYSKRRQWVSIVLVPEFELDGFAVKVRDERGNEFSAESGALTSFVVLQVEGGTRLEISLSHQRTGHVLAHKPYRLIVTGSENLASVERDFHQLVD